MHGLLSQHVFATCCEDTAQNHGKHSLRSLALCPSAARKVRGFTAKFYAKSSVLVLTLVFFLLVYKTCTQSKSIKNFSFAETREMVTKIIKSSTFSGDLNGVHARVALFLYGSNYQPEQIIWKHWKFLAHAPGIRFLAKRVHGLFLVRNIA